MTVDQTIYTWVLNWTHYLDKKAFFWDIISDIEKQRLKKLLYAKDQDKYLVTRGLLRILLATFTQVSPRKLQFKRSQFGKLELLEEAVQFNLSHSNHWVAYAICQHSKVGIDIEYATTGVVVDTLAKRYFSLDENQALHPLHQNDKTSVFFKTWVKKEAIVKAFGLGSVRSLSGMSVDASRLRLSYIPSQNRYTDGLTQVVLYPISTPSEYKGALAVLTDNQAMTIEQSETITF